MTQLNSTRFILQTLRHFWRTNLAVMFGVVAGTAVITGALIVGDSVRWSLRQMTLERLGKIDFALAGPRFVRENLADELTKSPASAKDQTADAVGPIAPAIVMRAGLQSKRDDTVRRAGQVNVYGFDDRAWSLVNVEGDKLDPPQGDGIVLNARAAEAVGAKIGDEVTLWIEIPSAVPRDTLLGKKDNDSQEITLKVSAIAPETTGAARLGLLPTQALPLNAFVDLHVLQERLGLEEVKPSRRDPTGKPARVNTLFNQDLTTTGSDPRAHGERLQRSLEKTWTLADLSLRVIDNEQFGGVVLDSEQMILEDKLVEAAETAAAELNLATSPVMVYLANKLWNPSVYVPGKRPGYSMYSAVAGLEVLDLDGTPFSGFEFVGEKPTQWGEGDVILNEFLATDLQAKVGDTIHFTYHTIGSRGELPELERTVTVRGIVAMTGAAIDRTLTPIVKGITDVASLADWDQPFPMDLDAVTPRDDEYWDSYRATPKLFMPLKTAQTLWPSRYGSLTSLRLAPRESVPESERKDATQRTHEQFTEKLLSKIEPVEVGLAFQPLKAIGLAAASGATDFSGLFVGFSLFLIIAAMILIGLLFRLGIEQRVRDLGLLGAVGFSARQVQRQMLLEGSATSLVGGLVGVLVGVWYARLMIYGLTHWWVEAVGTKYLSLKIQPLSLFTGFAIAIGVALLAIWWALRQLKPLSLREQLAGVTEKDIDVVAQRKRAQRVMRRAIICTGLAGLLMACAAVGVLPAPAAFFGIGILLLTASLSFLSSRLQSDEGNGVRGTGSMALGRLGLRNAARQRSRTVMTAGMIATATFLIITVAAFRRDPTNELPVKSSGNGGYTLVAESSSPLLYDINTPEGRQKLQLNPPEGSPGASALAAMHVVPFRVKPGEDASCLNLYQTKVPTILGVPQSMIDEGRFAFAMGSWSALNESLTPSAVPASAESSPKPEETGATARNGLSVPNIPVLGDLNTLMFSLHKGMGAAIAVPDENHPRHQLIVKGMFQDSIFQGVLVMSEENFLKLYPEQKGFRYFLIEVPPQQAEAAAALLETELAEYGFDTEPVAERLARFLSVQNTYLSTFQTLGGLGLFLGTFGLATVMLRNVLERQKELSLLRAVGFRQRGVAMLVLWENAFILLWGLLAGAGSALLATAPNLVSRGGGLPAGSISILLLIVFATGMMAAAFAVRSAIRLPIVATLRGE
ncbi:FtsX-like permease family protein [Schlesneria sp. DSM 10557]|uniref:FtsX-like permease family protein n=1 Tax=Schlesneria sp. DSM 10557 TaxID=3044399 RepID=UPI0035A0A28E